MTAQTIKRRLETLERAKRPTQRYPANLAELFGSGVLAHLFDDDKSDDSTDQGEDVRGGCNGSTE